MIRTLTIRNVPKEVRSKGAGKAINNLSQLLNNPFLNQEQRSEIQERIHFVVRLAQIEFEPVPNP